MNTKRGIVNTKRGMLSYLVKPFLFILLFIGIFGLVWLRSNIREVEYQIGMLEGQKAHALREKKILIAQRAEILSIREVGQRGAIAGLAFPDRKNVLYVKRDNNWGTHDASFGGDSILNEQKGGNP